MYLNNHTYFSLKYGTFSPNQLIDLMQQHVERFAITDINNTSVALEMIRLSQLQNIQIVPGIDFRNGAQQMHIGLAKNNYGWCELNNYLSNHLHNGAPFDVIAPKFENAYVIYPFNTIDVNALSANEFIGISPQQVNAFRLSLLTQRTDKLVVMNTVSFQDKRHYNIHRLLRAIDKNCLLSQLSIKEQAPKDARFYTPKEIRKLFSDYPEIIANTQRILYDCNVDLNIVKTNTHNNLQHYTGNAQLDFKLLKKLAFEGIRYRFRTVTDTILDRISMELEVIQKKNFVSYFLIAWKITKYARSKGYFYVGRGSGANSIISYLLRITDVDPMELDLYFERFINLFRQSPPDFDIDFSWKERQDVTHYIFKRFPTATLLAAYSTFKHKSVIRELGKVFGLPANEIDKLQKASHQADSVGKTILKYSQLIQGFPSHLTVHSAGILIPEKHIHHFSATFLPPKGFATTHFDMYTAEDNMLFKFDILGQRGLAKIKDALKIIYQQNHNLPFDIHDIPKLKADVKSNNLLRYGNAIGCFYIESPAMRMLLRKLRVSKYIDLVAASSVIRPGVAQSGMMREFIVRHRNPAKRKLAQQNSPTLYNLMPETYGVMVYQEDVIKVAHYFAGLTLAESDVLRRGMSGKYRSREEFEQVKGKFFSNCASKGVDSKHAQDIWHQIESFAGYAFAKGHSASYAVESYQCLYLKAHYPLAFMVATINNGGGFYSRELYLHEARKHGATVHLPCINQSNDSATLYNTDIYLGLNYINGLEQNAIQSILEERHYNGFFTSFRDFINRVSIGLEQLILLIRSNVFRFTNQPKKALLWDAHLLLNKTSKKTVQPSLFHTPAVDYTLPNLDSNEIENAFDEIELFGFTVTQSVFSLASHLPDYRVMSRQLSQLVSKNVTMLGYLVHAKSVRTKNGKRMFFGTFIDLEGEWIDTIMFPPIATKYPFTGPGCYILYGKVVEEFDYFSLEIIMQKRINSKNPDDAESVKLKKGSITR